MAAAYAPYAYSWAVLSGLSGHLLPACTSITPRYFSPNGQQSKMDQAANGEPSLIADAFFRQRDKPLCQCGPSILRVDCGSSGAIIFIPRPLEGASKQQFQVWVDWNTGHTGSKNHNCNPATLSH